MVPIVGWSNSRVVLIVGVLVVVGASALAALGINQPEQTEIVTDSAAPGPIGAESLASPSHTTVRSQSTHRQTSSTAPSTTGQNSASSTTSQNSSDTRPATQTSSSDNGGGCSRNNCGQANHSTTTTERTTPYTDPPPTGIIPGSTLYIKPELNPIPAGRTIVVGAGNTKELPTYLSAGPDEVCTMGSSTVRGNSPGTCVITAKAVDVDGVVVDTATLALEVVGKGPTIIRIQAPHFLNVKSSGTIRVESSPSDAPITVVVEGPCEFDGVEIYAVSAGGCTVTASQPENEKYAAATGTFHVVVLAPQLPNI